MIQDIFPIRFNNAYEANKTLNENDFIFHFQGNSLLMKIVGEDLEIPRKIDFPELNETTERIFLFSLDDVSCFLIWDKPKDQPTLNYKDISFFRTCKKKEVAWISIVGLHLMNWYAQNKFCGKCGSLTQHKSDERALFCTECTTTIFPKISPAIIVAIINKDKILLARNTNFPVQWYSLIAGYSDIGESLEETLIREVKEEVGLDVKNFRYYKSQPWPLSGSMMIGFVAETEENQPIIIDHKEIAEAAWFTRGQLPAYPSGISIAGEMIDKFERGEL